MAWIRAIVRLFKIALVLCLLAALSGVAATVFFPEVVCRHTLEFLLRHRGYRDITFRVDEARLDRLALQSLSVGPEGEGVSAETVLVSFSPRALLAKEIARVEVDALRATVLNTAPGWRVAGLPAVRAGAGDAWRIGEVILRDARVEVSAGESGVGGSLQADVLKLVMPRADALDVEATGQLTLAVGGDRWWSGLELTGGMAGSYDLRRGAGRVKLRDIGVAVPGRSLRLQGIEANIDLEGLPSLRTLPSQEVAFAVAELGGLRLSDGHARFQFEDPGLLHVHQVTAHTYGGIVTVGPFSFDASQPALEINISARGFALSELGALQTRLQCEAEGLVNGALHIAWQPGALPRLRGHLESPGESGRIQFTDPSLITRQMAAGDTRIKTVAFSLRDFRYDRFLLAVDLTDDQVATANLRLSGQSAIDASSPPINLNVNFEADVADLRYLGRLFSNLGRRARPASGD